MQSPSPPPSTLAEAANTGVMVWSALATTAAAVIALVAVVVTLRQRRADLVRAEERDLARARAHARLVRFAGRPVWEDEPDGPSTWGITLTNFDDRTILGVRPEFWVHRSDGPHGDSKEPFSTQPEILRSEQTMTFRHGFEPTEEDSGPWLSAWRIRWSDVDGHEWCYDTPGQEEPARYTGQPPTPNLH